ncbi:zinc transporter ZIP1-like [Argiope bruennichi]|uniref:Zinc transporter ZIP1 like protein n=1 Tax=Argiope bruennichi TaxID=94029 RepID=A0A8T0E1R0_ARGBR|nr:zinc transporter ZIP1-like [Argiope bruennichi]KAF8764393.1 Zinc transporter ZIP1 like protein [Argiope bruennichi]
MSALLASQISCMFLLLIGTLIFGISPVWVKKTLFRCDCESDVCNPKCRAKKGKLITSFLIYFGGGVLLGTTLLHLLPESREAFEDHDEECKSSGNSTEVKEEHGESFPIPEFIVCCGFFAVYLFEEIVHFYLGGHAHAPSENRAVRSFSRSSSCGQHSVSGEFGASGYAKTQAMEKGKVSPSPPSHHDHHVDLPSFSLTGLLTVAALSFHSLFEGFAVGLRNDALSTWIVFAAISVHKFVIAFVVGLEVLATGGKNKHVYSYMGVFSLMSPLGILIAIITQSSLEESNPMTVSVLNAIATGTLLYVTFFEILQRDEHKDIATWVQLVATVSGFIIMAIIQYVSTLA